MLNEIFKDIPGYEGLYEVSNFGKVKSKKGYKDKILKGHVSKIGYIVYGISDKKETKTFRGHQLVAMAFLNHKPCGSDVVVDHINGRKFDNRLSNLQLITNSENTCSDKPIIPKYEGVPEGVKKKELKSVIFKGSDNWISYFIHKKKIFCFGYYESQCLAIENLEKEKKKISI